MARATIGGASQNRRPSNSPGKIMTGATPVTEKLHSSPFLDDWTGPHGGFPPFDRVTDEAFKPAIVAAMDLCRREIDTIAGSGAAPDFHNTLEALEDSGRAYRRATQLFRIYTSTMSDNRLRSIEAEMAPLLSAFQDEIVQNGPLFARVKSVYDAGARLAPEQRRLADVMYRGFVRRGASLGTAEKSRLTEINKRLASLFTTFRQNMLADEESFVLVIDDESDLAGLPGNIRASAADAA